MRITKLLAEPYRDSFLKKLNQRFIDYEYDAVVLVIGRINMLSFNRQSLSFNKAPIILDHAAIQCDFTKALSKLQFESIHAKLGKLYIKEEKTYTEVITKDGCFVLKGSKIYKRQNMIIDSFYLLADIDLFVYIKSEDYSLHLYDFPDEQKVCSRTVIETVYNVNSDVKAILKVCNVGGADVQEFSIESKAKKNLLDCLELVMSILK